SSALPIAPASGGTGASSNGSAAGTGQPPTGMATPMPPAEPPPPPPPRAPIDCSVTPPAPVEGTQSCARNGGGTVDGQRWFMWFAGNGGCMTAHENGGFKATWNNSGDYLARMGLQWNETQTHDQIGTIGADFAFTRTGTGGSYSFIGVYGWSNDPLVEYYIVENSFGNGPAVPYATQQRGTFNLDGASYRIYTGTKTNQPSIHGNATFTQVFSVRQTPRQCGHISVSDHFRQWQGMGINLGKMYEARVLVEAGGGSGSATFTTAYVTVNGR
ncbi:MAG TPA: glycoside hydrolase family 11 protein, partial [Polyangiaceae bacterium]|nr:glycoside hydrolase family 11 protein [Polyangiaceae bacterium]